MPPTSSGGKTGRGGRAGGRGGGFWHGRAGRRTGARRPLLAARPQVAPHAGAPPTRASAFLPPRHDLRARSLPKTHPLPPPDCQNARQRPCAAPTARPLMRRGSLLAGSSIAAAFARKLPAAVWPGAPTAAAAAAAAAARPAGAMVSPRRKAASAAAAANGGAAAALADVNVDVTRDNFKQVRAWGGRRGQRQRRTGRQAAPQAPRHAAPRHAAADPMRRPAAAHAAEPPRSAAPRHARPHAAQVLPAVADALERCEFFALDCEMTGLFLDTNKSEFLDDVQDRWGRFERRGLVGCRAPPGARRLRCVGGSSPEGPCRCCAARQRRPHVPPCPGRYPRMACVSPRTRPPV
jgi:hypothetical protein